jgi:hypothetical protein
MAAHNRVMVSGISCSDGWRYRLDVSLDNLIIIWDLGWLFRFNSMS